MSICSPTTLIFLFSSFSLSFRFLFSKNVTQNMIDSFVYRIMRCASILGDYHPIFFSHRTDIEKKIVHWSWKYIGNFAQTKRHIFYDYYYWMCHSLSPIIRSLSTENLCKFSIVLMDHSSIWTQSQRESKLKYSAEIPAGNLFIAVSTLRHSELPHLICIDRLRVVYVCFLVWRFPMAMPFSLY